MPEEEVADVPLFEEGVPTFQIILAKNTVVSVLQAVNNTMKADIQDACEYDIDVFMEEDENDEEIDIEILIGDVTSRGDKYLFDKYTLGKEGYIIKIVGSKIIINGGSDKALIDAIESFTEFLLDKDELYDVVMTKEDTVLEIQDDYKVDSLKVNGNDMKGYTIAADLTRKYYRSSAEAIQDTIYEETGYWFNIVDIENATDTSIVMKHVDGKTGEDSFKVYADGTQLVIECAFDNSLENTAFQFTTQKIATARGDVDFKGTVFTQDISVVYYDDFGAVGDGRTDDFHAIRKAHEFANECGQSVKASRKPEGKVYYIYDTRLQAHNNDSVVSIEIKTNTDWQGVRFVIDDRKIPTFKVTENDPTKDDPNYSKSEHEKHYNMGKKNIFTIVPNEEHEAFTFQDEAVLNQIVADGLRPGTTKINLKIDGWDGGLMIVPYNSEHGVFRRLGNYAGLQSAGQTMHELIIIDKDGNVSPETPIMFEYTNIDYFTIYKLDPSTAITVGNATMETLEARVQNKRFDKETGKNLFSTGYVYRGIGVSRSYTVVENVKHEVQYGYTLKERADGFESSNYNGMFTAQNADHVKFKNCVLVGRMKYDNHSSYDLKINMVNKIVFEGCTQSNFWVTVDPEEGILHGHTEHVDGAYTSMSTVKVQNSKGELVDVSMCWGTGGTNYSKNMEYIDSQISRFDAHQGLYNGKVINSQVNYLALTGYGEMIVDGTTCYLRGEKETMLSLRGDYGYLWNGSISVKDTKVYIYDVEQEVNTLKIVGHSFTNFYFGYPTAFPSISIDNLDVYSTKNQAPVGPGFQINLVDIASDSKKMHLIGDCGKTAIFTYLDEDKDGYVDEPLFDNNYDGIIDEKDKAVDLDGERGPGNTSLVYADYADLDPKVQNKGIKHKGCTRNLNPIKPPEYIKIINNDGVDGSGGYTYNIVNTGGEGISDGYWYTSEDTFGGFFGGTKFIYGDGPNDYFLGSDHEDQTETTTFKFKKQYS